MIVDVVLSLLLLNPAFAQEVKCTKIADRFLDGPHYGTFSKPRSGVTKKLLEDGSYTFDAVAGPTVTFFSARKELTIVTYDLMRTNNIVRVTFDDNCEIVSLSAGPIMLATGPGWALASEENCRQVRMHAPFGPGPKFTAVDQLSLSFCATYFPEPEKNKRSVDHLPGTPVGPGTPGWDGKKKNTDN